MKALICLIILLFTGCLLVASYNRKPAVQPIYMVSYFFYQTNGQTGYGFQTGISFAGPWDAYILRRFVLTSNPTLGFTNVVILSVNRMEWQK